MRHFAIFSRVYLLSCSIPRDLSLSPCFDHKKHHQLQFYGWEYFYQLWAFILIFSVIRLHDLDYGLL